MGKLADYGKGLLKSSMSKLTDEQIHMFKQMYAHGKLDLHIDDVIDNMEDSRVEWALTQVDNTIRNNNAKNNS